MSDLIDRQAVIDALAKNMPSLTTPDGCGEFDHDIQVTDEAYVDCMQIIHELPSAQPEPQWIPVAERLPENKQEVLVTEYGDTDIGRRFDGRWLDRYGDKMKDVTAWMPKPEPYKEGGAV